MILVLCDVCSSLNNQGRLPSNIVVLSSASNTVDSGSEKLRASKKKLRASKS